jgi:3-oxoacyl-[acyl-carrier-protein] synthase II
VEKLNATVERDGPQYVSAVRAPNIVTSVPAGYISLELGLGGPLVAVCTGDASGLIALGHAADLIRQGQAAAVVVVAADEVTETLTRAFDCYGQLGTGAARPYARSADPGRLSAASAAVVLESADHARARGAPVLGELLGHAVTSGPGPQAPGSAAAWSRALRRALADAPARSVDVYGAGCGVPCLDAAEAESLAGILLPDTTRLTSLAGATGNCQSATPLLSLVAALELSGAGRLPAVPRQSDPLPAAFPYLRPGGQAGKPRTALVSAASWGGTYAAALVAPREGDR